MKSDPGGQLRSDDTARRIEPDAALDDTLAAITARLHLGASRGTLTLLGPARMRYPEALMIAMGVSQAAADNLSLGQN